MPNSHYGHSESVKQMNLTESERKRQRKGGSEGEGGERREKEMKERGEKKTEERLAGSVLKPIRVTTSKENYQLTDIQV